MPLDDFLTRKDWIAPRQDRWTDILPESWQTAINTSPTLNALARYMNRPSFEEGVRQWQDSIPGNSPIDRIADRKSTLAQEFPQPMNPLGQSLMETGGFLANFIGPGAKLPQRANFVAPNAPAAPKPQGIRAYHGSPHDFDKFDISKIGTGEGAQAYGRGLYFADSEGVAKSYRDNLSKAETRYFEGPNPVQDHVLTRALQRHGPDLDATIAGIKREIAQGHPVDVEQLTPVLAEAQRLKAAGTYRAERVGDPGKMYEVRINADPETFLDWDKPLSQQPEAVRRAVEKLPQADVLTRQNGVSSVTPLMEREGDAFYNALAEALGTPFDPKFPRRAEVLDHAKASQALRDAGIPGIKYKDQMSRGTDGGTSNFVVFDDAIIQILRKYGLFPPVAAGAAQALSQGQDTAY